MEKYLINPNQKLSKISKDIYGTFSEHLGRCIYEGVFVGEDSPIPNVNGMRKDVVDALKEAGLPVLRWPGGCFADEYHWKDGIGPRESRKKMINTHWGGVVEDNSFGTHEFFELCRQLGCDAYVTGNLGSGTVQEMSEWVEYMTFDGVSPMADLRKENGDEKPWRLKYFGVGNENWGCGGNMTADFYADQYRRYATYVRNYSFQNRVKKIACGPSGGDYNWTDVLMKKVGRAMDGLSLHYYTVPGDWGHKGKATEFTDEEYYATVEKAYVMEELIHRHDALMDRYDPDKRIALIVDEWGTWYDVEEGTNPGFLYQQSSMRDAMVAALTLNIFNKHCDRIHMANIAQLVNVLQSVILTEGPRMLLTPTYFIFKLYKDHQENDLLESVLIPDGPEGELPLLQESSSIAADGAIHVTLVNPGLDDAREVEIALGGREIREASARILTGKMDDHNTFDAPDTVKDRAFTDFTVKDGKLTAALPPVSAAHFILR